MDGQPGAVPSSRQLGPVGQGHFAARRRCSSAFEGVWQIPGTWDGAAACALAKLVLAHSSYR